MFLCLNFVGKTLTSIEKKELEVLPPLAISLLRTFVRYPGEHVLSGRQRGS